MNKVENKNSTELVATDKIERYLFREIKCTLFPADNTIERHLLANANSSSGKEFTYHQMSADAINCNYKVIVGIVDALVCFAHSYLGQAKNSFDQKLNHSKVEIIRVSYLPHV
jgi:hypothetical protein